MKKVLILFLLTSSFGLLSQTPDSAEVIRQVDSLIQLNRKLVAEKKYEEALHIIGMAETKAIKVTGKEHALYATLLFNYGRTYYFMKNDTAAERYYIEAKEIRERVLGLKHPDYAWSLNNLAYLYKANADYQRAEPLFIDAIAIRASHPGKDHSDYISSLIGLAEIYTSTAQYAKAEKLYIEVAGIREKTKGKESRDYATSLTNLVILYTYMGKHEEREHLNLQILEIWEKVTGKMHPDYAGGLINLANCYRDMARFEESEKLYFEARAILTETQNKQHPYYINCLDALANLYGDINRNDLAEPLYIEAIALREKINGKEHPSYATTLNNMGVMYKKIGNYKSAENLLWESCKIREKVLGKEHPYYAWSLNNLANLYWETGDQAKALALHKQALEIRKKILKPDHFDYLISLGNLSVLYHEMHDFEQAEKLAEEAIAGIEKLLGTEHYEYLKWKLNLAKIYRDMKRYEASERLFVEIKNAWKKAVGEEHPYYAAHLFNMGSLYTEMGNYERADSLFEESNRLYRLDISKGISYLSERELDYYSYRYNKQIHRFFSFACLRQNAAPAIVASTMDNALFFKGFLLENTRNLEKAIASTSDSTRNIHTRWKICQRRLSAEYSKPLGMRADISKIQSQSDSLEKILVRNVAGFTEARHNIGWRDIQAKLGPNEAAIEFIQFNFINAANERTDSTLYAALLLRTAWKAPRWIQLFEEKQLDSLLYYTGQRKADYVGKLYNHSDRGIIASRGSLYDLLWKPLERELAGIKTIYFSPSGLLHRINPGAIPLNADSTVADKYQLVQLGSTRQLVVPAKHKGDNNDALLFGGIRYETDSTSIRPDTNAVNTESTLAGSRGALSFVNTDSLLRSGTVWDYLPYTDKEVVAIERIMKSGGLSTQALKGYAATEESFKNIGQNGASSPRILHIATHGFFFPDPKDTTPNDREPVFKVSEHPMIRSGLLLAGANHAWKTGKPLKPGMEDGILTAYEISQMNLSNTELVVLSACETGLGDIQGNEGVYGLQRAFKIAGARYLLMSLWQVPDRLTAQLMTTFYKKWLEDKMEIPDAFRAAQKEMREQGFDPYYWAGFVLVE